MLSAILHPKTKVINGQHIKYTIQDSQMALCIESTDCNDLDDCLKVSQPEPFITVYGNEYNFTKFFVVFNNLKYEFSSYLEAMTHCIKLFILFKIDYTAPCELMWMFLTQYCYEMQKSTKSPVLNTFIKDIENMKSNKYY